MGQKKLFVVGFWGSCPKTVLKWAHTLIRTYVHDIGRKEDLLTMLIGGGGGGGGEVRGPMHRNERRKCP